MGRQKFIVLTGPRNVAGRVTPSRAPEVDSSLTLSIELSEETRVLTKQETLLGRGTAGKGNPRGLLCHMTHSLGFSGDEASFWLSLANHSDSGSFLVVHALLKQDGCSEKDPGRWWDR